MALTNLATFGDPAKNKIVQERGLRKLEYLQFSENLQVRRAATEGISNLVPHEEAVKMIAKDRLKLWLMIAEAYVHRAACRVLQSLCR